MFNNNNVQTNEQAIRIAHLLELIQLVKAAKSFTGDSRFSTLSDGTRVLVRPS